MNPLLLKTCKKLEKAFVLIPEGRKATLFMISKQLSSSIQQNKIANIIIICTHNSRRSHIGQLWLEIAADYYNKNNLKAFSGGTEATAVYPSVLKGLEKIGLQVTTEENKSPNPVYKCNWGTEEHLIFSKKYDHPINPKENFGVVMVCTDAEKNCPFIFNAKFRIGLPFVDPKIADRSPSEEDVYYKKVLEIGREMLFIVNSLKSH